MEALINKTLIKEYLGCDETHAHNLMSMIRTKVPTFSRLEKREYNIRGKNTDGAFFITSAMAESVMELAGKMLKNMSNRRINKEGWSQILSVCVYSINKNLALK